MNKIKISRSSLLSYSMAVFSLNCFSMEKRVLEVSSVLWEVSKFIKCTVTKVTELPSEPTLGVLFWEMLVKKAKPYWFNDSLRSKCFRAVSEQRKTKERDFRFWPREKWNAAFFTRVIFRAVFDSRSSFLTPKPYGNARYAG